MSTNLTKQDLKLLTDIGARLSNIEKALKIQVRVNDKQKLINAFVKSILPLRSYFQYLVSQHNQPQASGSGQPMIKITPRDKLLEPAPQNGSAFLGVDAASGTVVPTFHIDIVIPNGNQQLILDVSTELLAILEKHKVQSFKYDSQTERK